MRSNPLRSMFLGVLHWVSPCFGALLLSFLHCTAHAEVWGYIDERGVAHFAAAKLDARYELFFRDPNAKLAASAAEQPPTEPLKPVPVPAAAAKLVAFFEINSNYKAVKHHLRTAASAHGIDYALLQALISAESGFDPKAVSPKGAVGLMQLMPATAQRYGVAADARTPQATKLTDPATNIRAGSAYLADLIKLFGGNASLAVAAYNAGEGAVQRAGNKVPNIKETQDYVRTVMQLYAWLKPPQMQAPPPAAKPTPPAPTTAQLGGARGRGNMLPSLADSANTPAQLPSAAASAP